MTKFTKVGFDFFAHHSNAGSIEEIQYLSLVKVVLQYKIGFTAFYDINVRKQINNFQHKILEQ
ncbi:hypothetical protein DWB64_10970 [Fusibacter sp. A1]|nr:hypothetical protein DWB64_10970 [Fusibacter sp. A1]